MASTAEGETCVMCPRVGSKACKGCGMAKYCSKECQTSDWTLHKMFCKHFKDPKPDDKNNYVRALFFPVHGQQAEARPKLSWAKIEREASAEDSDNPDSDPNVGSEGFDHFDRKQHFEGKHTDHSRAYRNRIQARDIGRSKKENLIIWQLDCNLHLPLNVAISKVVRNRCYNERWRGPLLVFRELQKTPSNNASLDMDMREVRHAADFFTSTHMVDTVPTDIWQMYLAAMVNSPKEPGSNAATFGIRVIEQNNLVHNGEGSGIANLLGIPLLMRYDPIDKAAYSKEALLLKTDITCMATAPKTSKAESDGSYDIFPAFMGPPIILAAGRSPSKAGRLGFGATPAPPKKKKNGRIVVARADGEPLLGLQLEALCAYIEEEVNPMLAAAIKDLRPDSNVPERENVLRNISKANFEKFFGEYKVRRAAEATTAEERRAWERLHSLYDINDCYFRWSEEIGQLSEMQAMQEALGKDFGCERGFTGLSDFYDLPLPQD